jgi:hypothetical protein
LPSSDSLSKKADLDKASVDLIEPTAIFVGSVTGLAERATEKRRAKSFPRLAADLKRLFVNTGLFYDAVGRVPREDLIVYREFATIYRTIPNS